MAYVQYLRRTFRSLPWLLAAASLGSAPLQARDFKDSLVRIRAVADDGSQSLGSGVVIAGDLLATACHVTRMARTIEIEQADQRWIASAGSGSPTHDLCLVQVPHLDLPPAAIRGSGRLRLGEHVMAAGFPAGGNLVMSEGQVEGLYLYDGGNVIRTSATFDAGASGGGLFDDEGALVGLLAFKARSGAKLHFALPADWTLSGAAVSSQFVPIVPSGEQRAFWERPKSSQPSFLGLAMLEAASQRDSATSACNQPAGATSSP